MINAQDLEGAHPQKRLGGKQRKFLIGGLIIAATIGYLIYAAARSSTAYYVTISELTQGPSTRSVRVAGNVVGESIVWEARDQRLQFEIADEGGLLPVSYHGSRPDMFRDGAEVVVQGKLTSDGVFEAQTMLLKCPSKYEEAQ